MRNATKSVIDVTVTDAPWMAKAASKSKLAKTQSNNTKKKKNGLDKDVEHPKDQTGSPENHVHTQKSNGQFRKGWQRSKRRNFVGTVGLEPKL